MPPLDYSHGPIEAEQAMAHTNAGEEQLGGLADAVEEHAQRASELVPRIWERDHTVWQEDPTEVADRLGWLDCPADFAAKTDELAAFARQAADDGIEHVVLVGMGGSSLYPDVLRRVHGSAEGFPQLHVLDSTDPAAVLAVHRRLPFDRTLVIASSKSGTTIETRSHFDYFWEVLTDLQGVEAGRNAAAVTDPGSALAELGETRAFRAVFRNPSDIGGRFSALSYFGLVPAALLGMDLDRHLAAAKEMAEASRQPGSDNGPARLGALLAAAAQAGRNKLTLVLADDVAPFGDWVEQLIAESTGKHGVGILPVVGEPLGPPEVYGDDRLFVALGEHDGLDALAAAGHPVVRLPGGEAADLGGEVVRWEFATAVAGALLDINPFDQPDVAAAKSATSRVLEEGLPEMPFTPPQRLLDRVVAGDYVALLAFVDPDSDEVQRLHDVATRLRDQLHVPVTVGVGPRYLHSTGQLHKGGPPQGVFLVIVGEDSEDADIPQASFSFSTLKWAQAAGDLEALQGRSLRAGRVAVDDLEAAATSG